MVTTGGIVHLGADVVVEFHVVEPLQGFVLVEVLLLSSTNDGASDSDRNRPDSVKVGVEQALLTLLIRERFGQPYSRCIDHLLSDVHGLTQDSPKSDAREDIHVVSCKLVSN